MNAEELEKLHNLRKKGIITEEEFNSQKNNLLNKKKQSTFLWLALLLGGVGIHNFYVGQTISGVVKLLLAVLYLAFPLLDPFLFMCLWFWIIIEMCITDKTASGVNLIPASTACKVMAGCFTGVYIVVMLMIDTDDYMAALQ